jgi:hypothetical protein
MIRPEVTQVPRSGPSPHAEDLSVAPQGAPARRREDAAWEAVIREELTKLGRFSKAEPAADEGPGAPEPSPRAR